MKFALTILRSHPELKRCCMVIKQSKNLGFVGLKDIDFSPG